MSDAFLRSSIGRKQDARHSCRELSPIRGLQFQLLSSIRGEPVELGFAPQLGHTPSRLDPPAALHAVERRVERTFLHEHCFAGGVFDESRYRVAVTRSARERLEDERVERAVKEGRACCQDYLGIRQGT